MRLQMTSAVCVAVLFFLTGCTTEQAKKSMDKPISETGYSGFGAGSANGNKRKADTPKPVKDDEDPEVAVSTLVDQLKHVKAGYSVTAEEQLMYWGQKSGVGPIVARKVRPLIKSPNVEQRAPALRLMITFGGSECTGDLIECLADSEYTIRDTAYRALQGYVPQDLGYDPGNGDSARAVAVNQYRRYYQYKARNGSVQPPSIYENNPPSAAQVQPASQSQQRVSSGAEIVR